MSDSSDECSVSDEVVLNEEDKKDVKVFSLDVGKELTDRMMSDPALVRATEEGYRALDKGQVLTMDETMALLDVIEPDVFVPWPELKDLAVRAANRQEYRNLFLGQPVPPVPHNWRKTPDRIVARRRKSYPARCRGCGRYMNDRNLPDYCEDTNKRGGAYE